MPPKKATGAAAASKKTASPAHASYKDMIKDAIINLKERNGSSRQAIKKYVRSNNNVVTTSEAQFDSLFNKALRSGVEKGDFTQPKGPSGPVKLAKKESKPAEKKVAPKKETKAKAPKAEKKETKPKVAATKKAPTKKTTVKKAPTAKKTETKAKANTAKPRTKKAATKTETPAPAVTEVPTVLKKTKSGRVAKTKAPAKADKKAPAKKASTTKKAAPKKAAS